MNMREHINRSPHLVNVPPTAAKLGFGKAVNAGIDIKQSNMNLIKKTM